MSLAHLFCILMLKSGCEKITELPAHSAQGEIVHAGAEITGAFVRPGLHCHLFAGSDTLIILPADEDRHTKQTELYVLGNEPPVAKCTRGVLTDTLIMPGKAKRFLIDDALPSAEGWNFSELNCEKQP